jgi:hypothetical protein
LVYQCQYLISDQLSLYKNFIEYEHWLFQLEFAQ